MCLFISRRRHSRAIPQTGGSGVAGVALADRKQGRASRDSEGCGLLDTHSGAETGRRLGRRVGRCQ